MCSITPVECKIVFNELDIEVREGGSVLNQEKWELDRSSAGYAILNPHVSLVAPYLCLSFKSISNMCIRPVQCMQCCPDHGHTASDLKSLSTIHFNCKRKPCSMYNPRSFFYFSCNHLRVIYLKFICLTTNLVEFIDWVDIILSYSSYIQCLIGRFILLGKN